ncbi:uncharacterized protein L3040_008776 [Drepanopeziza brunnea f. sp. 'multigermtubi']|uniref:uncharacterized protein n=1 Tax=Drepanopeziza brunnea f. sp. 'multigermtubi' TaxID=698441 RepID=UPI0023A06F0F|nr:hypothetical protein L3040_008776 [Drepanopeziza brunnea f. sp. 'multigermtubi']
MSSASVLTAPDRDPFQSRLIEAKEAWNRTVERYHLDQQHVTLGQINTPRPKRFSGSTIDERAYACLRLLRPSPQRWTLSGVLAHLSRRRLVDRSREEAFRRYFGCSVSSPAPTSALTSASAISALPPSTPDAQDSAAAAAAAAATSMRFNHPAPPPLGRYDRCTADGTLRILDNLIRLIENANINDSDLPSTSFDYPYRHLPSSSTLAEHLGGFSSFWASLSTSEPSIRNSQTSAPSLVPELSAASSRLDFQPEETIAPTTPRFTDSPPSPVEDLDSLLRRTNINDTTPSKPPLFPVTTPASFSSSDTDSDSEIRSESTPVMPLPEDDRVRTSTESERMDLFNAFVNGCMASIQLAGGSKGAVWCTATSSQVRFQFGEAGKRGKTRTDTSTPEDVLNASFVACVDGVQFARPPLFGPQQQQQQQQQQQHGAGIWKPEYLALIEAKNRGREAQRLGPESAGVNAVRRQEGAELVACIYEDRKLRLKRAALAKYTFLLCFFML